MINIVSAQAQSTALPAAFYARWIDHSTWSQWSPDTEWVRLDGPAAQGTTGTLKPTGGPQVRFTISTLIPYQEYTDTSRLIGGSLVFQHTATRDGDITHLTARVSIHGPLAWLWARIMGADFRISAPADLDRLIALVEAAA